MSPTLGIKRDGDMETRISTEWTKNDSNSKGQKAAEVACSVSTRRKSLNKMISLDVQHILFWRYMGRKEATVRHKNKIFLEANSYWSQILSKEVEEELYL